MSEKICRLCLSHDDDDFTKLDPSAIGKVKAIIPELTLGFPCDTLVCSKCRYTLEKSFNLKRECSKTNDLIQTEKESSKSEKVNLKKFVKEDGSQSGKDIICRICLKKDGGRYFSIEDNDDFTSVLDYCAISLTPKPAVCSSCYTTLYQMYHFKKDCLSVDERIQSCGTSEQVDLNKVVMMDRAERAEEENDFLSGFEVKDEDVNDIFEGVYYSGESRKRSGSVSGQESLQSKKQRVVPDKVANEELPDFGFHASLLHQADVMIDEWLEKVEEYRKKFNWSDSITIHKVLLKLKPVKELYFWFRNIADIMDWPTWKEKLIRAFPPRNDYNALLKKVMQRKKLKEETYMSYCTAKINIMEPLNLTVEQKISLVFGGVTDILVCCIGRVGDYKTPEELLAYFKSCDDKQSVEAAAEMKSSPSQGNTEKPKPSPKPMAEKPFYQIPTIPNDAASKMAKKKCYICQKTGHIAAICRDNNKRSGSLSEIPTQKSPQLSPTHNPLASKKCNYCKEFGHILIICPLKKQHDLAAGGSASQPFRGSSTELSRCDHCGKFGSKKKPCCSARFIEKTHSGGYPQNGSSSQLCYKCHKPGHIAIQCYSPSSKTWR
ncbi:hypothetical protein NQ315_003010 [Exocentrus adspersus]|uniref:CCHC-type domain-containing protein n=1 Tax=Exocentrus adspersus TaxID=1586481 RepID=A0AAV8W4Q9_9CUCU|nr:hypothetical protein NQ315_003010 [Exocentrus adspersus]